jgi:hypothetical protein
MIPRCEKCTLVIEAIGDDKVRVNHQSLDSPLVILANRALEIIAAGKSLHIARAPRSAEYIDVEPAANPAGRPKRLPEFAPNADDPDGADRRTVGNLVIEARKFSGLAVDTLVELTKDNHADSTRFAGNDCPT